MKPGRRNAHRRDHTQLRFFLFALIGAAVVLASVPPAGAREPHGPRAKVKALLHSPSPLRVAVIGDSVAGDLARGLYKLFHAHSKHEVIQYTKPATGLMRNDVYDWMAALRDLVRQRKFDVAAVMIGGNDRQSIWIDKR
ncbi:MAG: DUF459 domain-containing protein, partial [Rhodospirillaceae bacterium]|nr:DUF459 domain-containing protein [Rhodospirillaceae bacterium]